MSIANPESQFSALNVLIIDDHTLFSEGIASILRAEYNMGEVDQFPSIDALEKSEKSVESYQLFISDMEIPNEDVLSLLFKLKNSGCTTPIMVLTMHNKLALISKCKEMAIEGYLLKDDKDELMPAINQLLNGETYYSKRVLETYALKDNRAFFLSSREIDVVRLLAAGRSDAEISEQLFISLNTVRTHKRNMKLKLKVERSSQLVKYAIDNDLL